MTRRSVNVIRNYAKTKVKVEEENTLGFSMEDIVNLCKRKGFVFQSSEIYSPMSGI